MEAWAGELGQWRSQDREKGRGDGRRSREEDSVGFVFYKPGAVVWHVCNVGPESQVCGRTVSQMALQISIASSNAYKVPATDELLPLRHEFKA